jgi:acyl-ACP thioesterase
MFTFETKVYYSRADKNGQVPLFEIMNYLQDCSTFHSENNGVGVAYMKSVHKAWVLVSYQVRILKPLKVGMDICVSTAPTDFGKLFCYRKYQITDTKGQPLVQADSIWVLIDLDSRKLLRVTDDDRLPYSKDIEPEFEDVHAIRKLSLQGEKQKKENLRVLRTYIDNNGHMNNADYLRAAAEFIPEDFNCSKFDIVYQKEAMEHETIIPYLTKEEDGLGILFENEEGQTLATIKLYE